MGQAPARASELRVSCLVVGCLTDPFESKLSTVSDVPYFNGPVISSDCKKGRSGI